MGAISGRYACAELDGGSNLLETRKWTISKTINDITYASCETGDYKSRPSGGRLDVTGTIEGVFDPDNPIITQIDVGDVQRMNFYHDTRTGGTYHAMSIKILKIDLEADIEEGEVQPWTMDWGIVVDADNEEPEWDQTVAGS
ncbi:hypothetical protein [Kordiimonas sp.]|uniref:hypothetical protein n=1 Tax=Kordiimonas sp. TaxID=1970157 RepID=UPI003A90CF49